MSGNMMKCPDCGREVSKDAASCPGCGKVFKETGLDGIIAMGAPVAAILFVVLFIAISCTGH